MDRGQAGRWGAEGKKNNKIYLGRAVKAPWNSWCLAKEKFAR